MPTDTPTPLTLEDATERCRTAATAMLRAARDLPGTDPVTRRVARELMAAAAAVEAGIPVTMPHVYARQPSGAFTGD